MKTRKNNPFKVPKGYFDTLEENLVQKTKANHNAYGLQTPKGYFDRLEKEILYKTQKKDKKVDKNIRRILVTSVSIAASFLFFFTVSSPSETLIIENKEQAFDDYIETYYLEEFNSYELLTLLEEGEIETSLTYNSKP
jgi:hypothetical protein|tara:strand:- start:465 stop:878 length:414 start_codon:yes stop_codon:yes gene_type:complete